MAEPSLDEVEGDEDGGEGEEAEVDVGAALVAHHQTAEPGEGAFAAADRSVATAQPSPSFDHRRRARAP